MAAAAAVIVGSQTVSWILRSTMPASLPLCLSVTRPAAPHPQQQQQQQQPRHHAPRRAIPGDDCCTGSGRLVGCGRDLGEGGRDRRAAGDGMGRGGRDARVTAFCSGPPSSCTLLRSTSSLPSRAMFRVSSRAGGWATAAREITRSPAHSFVKERVFVPQLHTDEVHIRCGE